MWAIRLFILIVAGITVIYETRSIIVVVVVVVVVVLRDSLLGRSDNYGATNGAANGIGLGSSSGMMSIGSGLRLSCMRDRLGADKSQLLLLIVVVASNSGIWVLDHRCAAVAGSSLSQRLTGVY